jgi:amino acid adenylation domain-containing protein
MADRGHGGAPGARAAYWRAALAAAPGLLALPSDRKRPARQNGASDVVELELDETLTSGLKALSRRHGLTLPTALLAGWALVLSRLSGQEDLVIGTPAEPGVLPGFPTNPLALRIDLSGAPTVAALLDRVQATTLAAQTNRDLPFEQLVALLETRRSPAQHPIFQVMFTWQDDEAEAPRLPAAELDLTLISRAIRGRIRGELNYATALFDRATIERWGRYWREALRGMVADSGRIAAAMPLLSPAERHQLLTTWNATQAAYPVSRCIHELFEAQAELNPAAPAILFADERLSYGALNAHANRLARHLRSLGVGPDRLVAICVERSFDMIVGLLAVLKAGGAYVPLDPAYPSERLGLMLQDSRPAVALTHGTARSVLRAAMPGLEYPPLVVDLIADNRAWADQPATNLDPKSIGLTPRNLAYIIYTSGSTGTPKGVMVEHRQLVASSVARLTAYEFHPVRPLLVSSFSFDSSKVSIYWPLIAGGQIALPASDLNMSAAGLAEVTERYDVTILLCTPSLYRAIMKDEHARLSSLKAVIVAGESFGRDLIDDHQAASPTTALINEYGPTECTVWASYCDCSAAADGATAPSIGRPIANARIYLLDAWLEPVPRGASGEIYIGGAGVARGYLKRAGATAARFVANPFGAGERLYKTGDLGRYLPDGRIEFLGRNDFQVKIRGFRIELGEIEAQLASHAEVRAAIVLAREDRPGDPRLVAYYTPADPGGPAADVASLKAHLSARLPDYMVPAAYVRLTRLPLTPNGKLDRKALPAPGADAYLERPYEAPVGPLERRLAEIWAQVLGIARVGRHDNFFDLGGHSLLATLVINQIRAGLGVELPVRALFEAPSVAQLAGHVDALVWLADDGEPEQGDDMELEMGVL